MFNHVKASSLDMENKVYLYEGKWLSIFKEDTDQSIL